MTNEEENKKKDCNEILQFKFLKDVPLRNEDRVSEFYHDKLAPALQEILENDSCVHTIGLFSRWGTGKSTVIEMIRDEYEYPMFVFDAWKYQDDSLRRIFLIELVEFLIKEGEDIDRSILYPLYIATENWEDVDTPKKQANKQDFCGKAKSFLKTNWILIVTILLSLVWGILVASSNSNHLITQSIANSISILVSFSLLGILLKPIFEKIWQRSVDKFLSSLGPLSTIKTKVEKEERLNSPEQFEILFQKIVRKINKRFVIVFDNIDRVQGDTAIKILSTIKTFLDPTNETGLTFIVPCDSDAINNQIKSFYKDKDRNFDPSEYLRKLFNVIIWMPEFIDADLHSFIKTIIEDTGEIKKLLQDEGVTFVIGKAFSNNPREIKQFINNLISALVLASKTEVWDRIKDNVPYLAKVLVLKQKYPIAYQELKKKWYDPENISSDNDENGLQDFMLITGRITVDNAEPFLYFKEPTISRRLNDFNGLTRALVGGDKEGAKKIIKKENNNEAVVDFVEHLLTNHHGQKNLQKNIFSTNLEAFSELKITTQRKSYYETFARTLDTELWHFFAQLPTDLIFANLLAKDELDDQFRKPLIERYILVLNNETVHTPDGLDVVKTILTNLKQNLNFLDNRSFAQISKSIDKHFSSNFEIIALFENLRVQEHFITPQAFEKFVANIDGQTFLKDKEIFLQFKEYIIKKKKFDVILKKIVELIHKETSECTDYREEKETFMKAIGEIFSEFEAELDSTEDEIKIQLIEHIVQAFNGIGDWNNCTSLVNNLRWLYFAAPENQKNQLQDLINRYFLQASAPKVEEVLDYWEKKNAEGFIDDFFPSFSQRSMQDKDYLDVIYKRANNDKKIELLTNLISQNGANSLDFIKELGDNLPGRQTVIKNLLDKLPFIQFREQVLIYDYLPSQIKINDSIDLKNQVVNLIKELLKSDDSESQEAGLKLLTDIDSLGEEKNREIGKEVLDWLREPSKVLNSEHRFVLKSVASLIPIMQDTPINDFTYILFGMIKEDADKLTLEVSLEVLGELKPRYIKHKKDFRDTLDRLKAWSQNENKMLAIEKIKNLKSNNLGKEEREFWKEVENEKNKETK